MALNFKSEHFPGLLKIHTTIYNYHDTMNMMESYVASIVRYSEKNNSLDVDVVVKKYPNHIDVVTRTEGGTNIQTNRNMLWPDERDA